MCRQEHGLRGGDGRLRRPREQGDVEQRRAAIQEVQAGEDDQHGRDLVRRHPPGALSQWSYRPRMLAEWLRDGGSIPDYQSREILRATPALVGRFCGFLDLHYNSAGREFCQEQLQLIKP